MLPDGPLELAEDSDHLAEDLDVLRVDGLEGVVLRLEPDAAFLAEEALEGRLVGRLVVAGQSHHDVAVARVLPPLDDRNVPVEDACVDHRVALDAEEELLPALRERLGDREIVLDVLVREQGPACGDLADERELVHVGRRLSLGLAVELDRARLRRIALEETCALEVREVRMHRRGRREADRLTDLTNRRRVAVRVHVLRQEVENLALPLGEHWASFGEHVFDQGSQRRGRRQTKSTSPTSTSTAPSGKPATSRQ